MERTSCKLLSSPYKVAKVHTLQRNLTVHAVFHRQPGMGAAALEFAMLTFLIKGMIEECKKYQTISEPFLMELKGIK